MCGDGLDADTGTDEPEGFVRNRIVNPELRLLIDPSLLLLTAF